MYLLLAVTQSILHLSLPTNAMLFLLKLYIELERSNLLLMQVECYLGVLLGSTAALNNLHADADHGETKGPTATFPESF